MKALIQRTCGLCGSPSAVTVIFKGCPDCQGHDCGHYDHAQHFCEACFAAYGIALARTVFSRPGQPCGSATRAVRPILPTRPDRPRAAPLPTPTSAFIPPRLA